MYKNFPSITVCRRFQSFSLLQADKFEIAKTTFLLELQNLKQQQWGLIVWPRDGTRSFRSSFWTFFCSLIPLRIYLRSIWMGHRFTIVDFRQVRQPYHICCILFKIQARQFSLTSLGMGHNAGLELVHVSWVPGSSGTVPSSTHWFWQLYYIML